MRYDDTQKPENDGFRRQFLLEIRNRFELLREEELANEGGCADVQLASEEKYYLRENLQHGSRESFRIQEKESQAMDQ